MAKEVKRSKKKHEEKIEYEFGSGNVFVDFGYPNPEEADAKSDLAFLIRSIIKKRKLTQAAAAKLIGIDQPKVSKIIRGLLSEFTIERLMNYLVHLGVDIEIKPVFNKSILPSIHVSRTNSQRRLSI